MIEQRKETRIARPVKEVYEALANASVYSRLTPSSHGDHRYETMLRDGDQELVFCFTPGRGLKNVQWRRLRPHRCIEVHYLRYAWPVKDYTATWRFEECDAGTRVDLHYRMGIAVPWIGDWVGRRVILPFFFGDRTQAVLEEIRERIEADAHLRQPEGADACA